jgi:hypothetical protein
MPDDERQQGPGRPVHWGLFKKSEFRSHNASSFTLDQAWSQWTERAIVERI